MVFLAVPPLGRYAGDVVGLSCEPQGPTHHCRQGGRGHTSNKLAFF